MHQDCEHKGSPSQRRVPDLWELTVLRRQGLPPLRFKGQRRARLRRAVAPDAVLEIELWARRKGGFVLTYSDIAEGAPMSQALTFAHLDDALEHLEALCTNSWSPTRQPDLATALSNMLRAASLQQQFAILVGEFLAAIDDFEARREGDIFMEEV